MRFPRLLPFLLIPAIPLVQIQVDRRLGAFRPQEEVLYLSSGEHLKKFFPGFEDLLADIYWLRTVQYFGSQRVFSEEKRFDLLFPLVDITTTLDSRLRIAYKYGAVFLCEPRPLGKGDCQAGLRILEKGTRALPNDWRLRQDLGYFRYIFLKDAKGGAEILLEAAKIPGAAFWLVNLAEVILAKGEDRQTAREIWRRIYEQEEQGSLRDNARDNLQRLDALDAVDALNAFVDRFRTRSGRVPRSLEEIVAAGVDPRLLADPTGVPFEYDPAAGRFWMARQSRLWIGKPKSQ